MTASVLGTRVKKPQRQDLGADKRTLWYLNRTKEWQLALVPGYGDQLVVFADLNWGMKDDKKRRSRMGIMIKFGTAPIFMNCKREKLVCFSSPEAEDNALGGVAATAASLRRVLNELAVQQVTTTIRQDNVGAVDWAEGGPTKHFAKRKQIE